MADISWPKARPDRRLRRTGTTSASPTVDVDLAGERQDLHRFILAVLAAASRSSSRRPTTSQTLSAASSRPGRSSTGLAPTKPSAAVSPGRDCHAMNRKPSFARQDLHAVVVAAAARASNRDNRVNAFRRHRDVETAATVIESRNPATAFDIRHDQPGRRVDNAAATHRQHANARFAHRDPGDAGRRKGREVGDAQALAGTPQRNCRVAVAAGAPTLRRLD